MYVGLIFSLLGVSFDLDSFGFEAATCGSAKHNASPKEQSARINPVVFIFMRRSNLDLHFPSTFFVRGRYEAVNAMLLNEVLKEHSKNERQEATIADLKAEIATPSATVKEQAAQIQRVNAFLEDK